MILSDVSIRRPVFASVINLLVIIVGLVAFSKLPLREFPDIDAPVVSVETTYIGASSKVIETRVTQILEDSISGIEGIKSIDSKSQDGISTISVEFNIDRNVDEAANDIRDRVSRVTNQLPEEADPPQISKLDANTQPIFWMALQSDKKNALELTDYADRYLVDRFSVLPGVSKVQIGGERRYAMRIWLDRKAMAARGITSDDVVTTLRRENVELPGGRIESLSREFSVRIDRVYNKIDDFKNLVIKRGSDGYLVRLGDIAKVEKGARDERTELRYNGRASIGLGLAKQSNANTLTVIRAAKEEMAKVQENLPKDVVLEIAFDSAVFIESAIHEVYKTIFETVILVVIVIWLFLGSLRATIIPAIAIPVSLIGAMIFLWALGYSINLLTLLALILAIGLVVDDAIVVLENIYKRIEHGTKPLAAAFLGTKQVSFAVIATTLVLVAVFLPVSMIPGDAGKLFTEFAWAMIGAILFSAFTALSLSPMLSSQILKYRGDGHDVNFLTRKLNGFLDRATDKYLRVLDKLFVKPRYVFMFMAVVIGAGAFFFSGIKSEYVPTEDRGYFLAVMMAPEGSSLEYAKRHMKMVEDRLVPLLPKYDGDKKGTGEARGIVTIVPAGFSSTGAVNGGFSFVLLEAWEDRARKIPEILYGDFMKGTPGLFQSFSSIPGALAFPIQPSSVGSGGFEQPVQFVIGGPSYADLAKWRDKILPKIRANSKLTNVDWDYKETKPQLDIAIDRDRAAELGISVEAIGSALQTFFGSLEATTYLDQGEEYDVVLQGQDQDRVTPTDMNNLYVRSTRTNELIPLSNLVKIQETADAGSLNRYNRVRAITFSAGLAQGYTVGEALKFMETLAKENLPAEARIDYKGESSDFKNSGQGIYLTFLLALVAVYLFLAAQFENWVHPFVIMMTVPLAIVGALWGLFLSNATLNIYTQIGLIMLVGLATKNGILIVEFANQLRDEGVEFTQAIKTASQQRIRPIIMTSVAAVAGAIPLVLASGAGAESRFPIGVVIFAGVIFATFFTLFVVPTFYSLLAKNTSSPETTGHHLEEQLQEIDSTKDHR